MNKLDIRSRLFGAFILILLLAATSLVVTAAGFQVSNNLLRRQLTDFQRLKAAGGNGNIKYFSQMETAEFRFRSEQDLSQEEYWNEADTRLRDLLRLQRLNPASPAQENALRQIQNRLDEYGVLMRQMFELGQEDRWDEIDFTLSAQTRTVRNIMNDWAFDNYKPILTTLNDAWLTVETFNRWSVGLQILALLIFGAASLLIWLTIYQQYTTPLAQIEQIVAQMNAGNFDPAALDGLIQRGGDLGELAEAARNMGQALSARRQAAQAEMDELRSKLAVE